MCDKFLWPRQTATFSPPLCREREILGGVNLNKTAAVHDYKTQPLKRKKNFVRARRFRLHRRVVPSSYG